MCHGRIVEHRILKLETQNEMDNNISNANANKQSMSENTRKLEVFIAFTFLWYLIYNINGFCAPDVAEQEDIQQKKEIQQFGGGRRIENAKENQQFQAVK